jgi:hypothetical protein
MLAIIRLAQYANSKLNQQPAQSTQSNDSTEVNSGNTAAAVGGNHTV